MQYGVEENVIYSMMLTDIDGCDTQHVWASATDAVSDFSVIYSFNGTDWERQLVTDKYKILALEAVDANNVWAIGQGAGGSNDAILFFNGETWTEQYQTDLILVSIAAAANKHAWVTDEAGKVLSFNGEGWTYNGDLKGSSTLIALDANHVWATVEKNNDQSIVYYYDGSRWIEQYNYGRPFER